MNLHAQETIVGAVIVLVLVVILLHFASPELVQIVCRAKFKCG